jgi:hypothetical protein
MSARLAARQAPGNCSIGRPAGCCRATALHRAAGQQGQKRGARCADTNADPDQATVPIPCNDDAIRSIRAILEPLAEAIEEGRRSAPAVPATASREEKIDSGEKKPRGKGRSPKRETANLSA